MAAAMVIGGVSLVILVVMVSATIQSVNLLKRPEEERHFLYDVDVTCSAYLDRPGPLSAVAFAAEAHAGQFRKTGEPYVQHCIETALLTEQMVLHLYDTEEWSNRKVETVIVAALLHDVMDTGRTYKEISAQAGKEVAEVVSAVARLSRNNQLLRRAYRRLIDEGRNEEADAEVEAIKAMILQMTEEPLVIIVKLADRLHNMRTVWALKPEKARHLARETLQVWCPMCECLGLSAVKAELEDICFAVHDSGAFHDMHRQREHMLSAAQNSDSESSSRSDHDYVEPGREVLNASVLGPVAASLESAALVAHDLVSETALARASPAHGSAASSVDVCAARLSQDDAFRFSGGRDSVSILPQQVSPSAEFCESQLLLRECLALVIPFRANNFMTLHTDHRPGGTWSAAMRRAEEAASALMGECLVDAVGTGFNMQIQGRVKSLYSIHRKMSLKGVPMEEVYDSIALRVIVSDSERANLEQAVRVCYQVVPKVRALWKPIANEFDDYISSPKESGYQSIHMAVAGPGGVPFEVQIRTSSMHYDAEYGAASHWMYKDHMKALLQSQTSPSQEGDIELAAAPSATSGPRLTAADYASRVAAGQAALVVDEGSIRDAVVIGVSADPPAVLAATTRRRRWHTADSIWAPLHESEYTAMWQHADEAGWDGAGQHDSKMRVRQFVLSEDGKHVYVDHLGGVYRDCTLSFVSPAAEASDDNAAQHEPVANGAEHERTIGGAELRAGKVGKWPHFRHAAGAPSGLDADKVVQLRASLEWGAEAAAEDAAAGEALPRRRPRMPSSKQELFNITNAHELVARIRQEAAAVSPEMTVLLEPGGLRTVPRGVTARDVVKEFGLIEVSGGPAQGLPGSRGESVRVVNVNNELVPEDTLLKPGDLVVLSNHVLADV